MKAKTSSPSGKDGRRGTKRRSSDMPLMTVKQAKKASKPQRNSGHSTPPVTKPKKIVPPASLAKKKTTASIAKKPTAGMVKKRQKRSTEAAVPFKNFYLKPAAYAKWKPLSKATEMFVRKILDTNLTHTIKSSNVDNMDNIEEIQDTLNALHASLMRAIHGLKVPKPAVTSYRQLQATTMLLEAQLVQNKEQIERLEHAIIEEDELTATLEEERERLESGLDQPQKTPTPEGQKVHPSLHRAHLAALPVCELDRPARDPGEDTGDMLEELTSQAAAISALL